jgi:aminoglycoside 6-adenylyltransferase
MLHIRLKGHVEPGGNIMRIEMEMLRLFLDIANADNRILAVYMNGSRTNPNVEKDIFQDYDVVFVVTKTQPFILESRGPERSWISQLGNILYMQYPDEHPDFPNDKENFYGWLMQFDDGSRVDLHVESVDHAKEHICDDKLCKILLDKEKILPEIPKATDEDYHIKQPSEAQFSACANEFWWCSNNLAKGLWRKEMPYVQDMANFVVRKQLEKMLSWKVGIKTGFRVSVGKSAKYLYKWLEKEEYQNYLNTYFGGNMEEAWEAIFLMCDLFSSAAGYVAENLGYFYNVKEEKAAGDFLKAVRMLPEDAEKVL